MSIGIKGLRVGAGPRGHYVQAGVGGIYYRATMARAAEKRKLLPARPPTLSPRPVWSESGVTMVEIDSGDVSAMREEKFSEVLDEINSAGRKSRLSVICFVVCLIIGAFALSVSKAAAAVFLIAAIPAFGIGSWLDSYRRRAVLMYNLDDRVSAAYEALTHSFDNIRQCRGRWHIAAGGTVHDLTTWKRNAGASHLVKKKDTALAYGLPKIIATNIDPPSIAVGSQTIFFLPDVALIYDGRKFGAVDYKNLRIRWNNSRFIEEGPVPSDTMIVGYNWAHPNKKGGPDRRFSNNRQIPVCLYETLHLSSESGVNELLEFSRTGVSEPFANSIEAICRLTVTPPPPILARQQRLL